MKKNGKTGLQHEKFLLNKRLKKMKSLDTPWEKYLNSILISRLYKELLKSTIKQTESIFLKLRIDIFQRGTMSGQQTYKKMLSITSYWWNANQCPNEMPEHTHHTNHTNETKRKHHCMLEHGTRIMQIIWQFLKIKHQLHDSALSLVCICP